MKKHVLRIAGAVIAVALVATVLVAWPRISKFWSDHKAGHGDQDTVVADQADVAAYIELLPSIVELNGIRTTKVTKPTRPRKLELRGQLNFDPDTLMHVHARFPGQIIDLAQVDEPNAVVSTETLKTKRDISFMDHVLKDQELGVLWSKDLGEKKTELVSALIRLRVDQLNLQQYKKLYQDAAVPEKTVREAERLVEQDQADVQKARMTLRSWLLSPQEIDQVTAEAERLHKQPGGRNAKLENEWARVAIVAPRDGTIVEKNLNKGDIVDTDADLFKIVDLSRLMVVARIYEEDLRYLEQVQQPIQWTITINSMPGKQPISGVVERVGDVIDPYEHVALMFGKIENPRGELLAGQFIKASIEIPEHADVVEIPTRAVVEDGNESVVLVRVDKDRYRFAPRRVLVVRRFQDVIRVRSALSDEERAEGYEELHEGEEIVSAGALELKAALTQQQ